MKALTAKIAKDAKKFSTAAMAKTTPPAVYNSRSLQMPTLPRFLRATFVLAILGTTLTQAALPQDWTLPIEQLAAKIIAVTGPGAVFVEVANRSSLDKSEVETVRGNLLTDLAASGARFVPSEQAAATVSVSLSENLRSYVWVAEIRQGINESSVVMISVPRPQMATAPRETSTLSIRKTPLWQSEQRILDAALVSGSPHMIILYAERIALYRLQDNRWQEEQSAVIPHSKPWPRDLRGRLVLRKDRLFDAYLPGVICQSTAASLTLNCREGEDPWPLGTEQFTLNAFFTPARNYFTGALSSGIGKQRTVPAFYSAAPLPRQNYTLWLLATVDGQVHILDGMTDQAAGKLGWGSDIATVR
ncbi:MAG TPA: hypothetical protein VH744_11265, partial [Terriglobales bacterium]